MPDRSIAILGAGGLLGAHLVERASKAAWRVVAARSHDVDARDQTAVSRWLTASSPDALIVVAGRNTGLGGNLAAPLDMLDENARIALGSILGAREAGVRRLLYCSSTVIYPPQVPQPYNEADACAGDLEVSHLGYNAAKRLAVHLCEAAAAQDGLDYTALLLTNLYGPRASFDPKTSNVVPAMLRRMHEAKALGADAVSIWGSGNASRDLLYVDDAADAILIAAEEAGPEDGRLNIASGQDVSIRKLAGLCAQASGFHGRLDFDPSKPEGAPSRSVDVSRLKALGWAPVTSLEEGLKRTYDALTASMS